MQLLTPSGAAGVAVVHFDAAERSQIAVCLRSANGHAIATRAGEPARRAALCLDGDVVDEVLVVDRGARGLEVHTHGSPAVLCALTRSFPCAVPSAATPAARLLRDAICTSQLDLALEQLALDFDRFCRETKALPSAEREPLFAAARERTRVALAQVVPARLVLAGTQNAGKSSLCNRLLFRERVLVGPTAGLTRDPVAELTTLDGYPYELVDTAGEGTATTPLERDAIERGRRLRGGALLILVVDAHRGPAPSDRELAPRATLVFANKADLPMAPWPDDVPRHVLASCLAEDAVLLRGRVGAALRQQRGLPAAGPVGGVAALNAADAGRLR